MYFVAVGLGLTMQQSYPPFSATDGAYVHAAIMQRLIATDPIIGQRIHDTQRFKSIGIAIVQSTKRSATLRLAALCDTDVALTSLIMDAFGGQPILRLGAKRATVDSIDVSGSTWTGCATWSDFLVPPHYRSLMVHFVTPTAWSKFDTDTGRFTWLFPDPSTIFGGLSKRWHGLGGPPLPEGLGDYLASGGCVVAHFNLATQVWQSSERTQIGITGHVVYDCRKPHPDYVRAINALIRFATFASVGYHTAQGMGVIRASSEGRAFEGGSEQ